MKKIRVAIVGVGNCASSLVQGIEYYREAREGDLIPGLMHVKVGDYHIRDIEVVCGFDVDADKVGKDVSEAIVSGRNNTIKICDVPRLGAPVYRGHTLDGFGRYYRMVVEEDPSEPVNVAETLARHEVDVLVNYLPVGSEKATHFYVEEALKAGCGIVNCIPVFVAREEIWQGKFRRYGLPIVGDDIKSQVGATIVHRVLAKLFNDRGVILDRTAQLNIGGNMDFMNMLERERLESKKISKTDAVVSQLNHNIDRENVHIGPSDYVAWLDDRKWAYIRLEGREFGDVPMSLEFKLEVWDSPNSAGIVIDAIRCCRLAMDRGMSGALIGPSAYFMKSPPVQYSDEEARRMVEDFIAGNPAGMLTTADFGNGKDLEVSEELAQSPPGSQRD
ncbi:MAG: inositol-3-phosphate synthase [Actinobacteria bacterium]|nr:inositol-3-phosphate synthase [Actinomycetota bacterium]MDI6830936.1 inositol-3-phosphate synthase [Actinomycetota bacterium]